MELMVQLNFCEAAPLISRLRLQQAEQQRVLTGRENLNNKTIQIWLKQIIPVDKNVNLWTVKLWSCWKCLEHMKKILRLVQKPKCAQILQCNIKLNLSTSV